jgi:uncharacterized membrane protein YhaH (DUF805 family)
MNEITPVPPVTTPAPQPALPPEGWYADSEVAGGQRWWNGQAWTGHRNPPMSLPAGTASEPPLWAPWYGIPFGAAVRRAWKKYADFDGRASMSEYWWWALFTGIVSFGGYLVLIVSIGITAATGGVGAILLVLVAIAYAGGSIALIIPSIAVGVRRLHDANYPGPMYLLVFVPLGSIIVLVFMLMPSNPAGARYDRG